jgi:hypothetical protein
MRSPIKFARMGLVAVAVATLAVVAGSSATVSGMPLRAVLRDTPHDFAWDAIGHTAVPGESDSVATAFVGDGEYFSGERSRVFFLGSSSTFRGRFLVYYPDQREHEHEVRFYLDYRPVKVRVRAEADVDWQVTAAITSTGRVGGRNVYQLELADVPEGRHDFAMVVRHRDFAGVPRIADQELPMVDQDIYVVQAIRGSDQPQRPAVASPGARVGAACKAREARTFTKNDAIAVVNCLPSVHEGVIFGQGEAPTYYSAPPNTILVFSFPELERVSHVSKPFEPMETIAGERTDSHDHLVGF